MNVLVSEAKSMAHNLAETLFMTRKRKRVLLVEDDPIYSKVASIMIDKIGCDVTTVANGRDAVESVRNEEFDLCMIDLCLPDISGMDVATQLQIIHPKMTVVLYSGSQVNASFMQDALDNGFTILGKPLRPQNVLCFLNRSVSIGS